MYTKTEAFNKLREHLESNSDAPLLLSGGTGVGKTFNLLKIAVNRNIKMLVCLPNISTVKSTVEEYTRRFKNIDMAACYHENNINMELNKGTNIVICTLDQLRSIRNVGKSMLRDYSLIIDEAHTLITSTSFKSMAIQSFERLLRNKPFKNVSFVTATPNCLTGFTGHHVPYKKSDIKEITIKEEEISNYVNWNGYISLKGSPKNSLELDDMFMKANEIVENAKGKVLILSNASKVKQELIGKYYNWDITNADKKHEAIYKSIVTDNMIPEDVRVLLTTDLFSSGNNIYNEDYTDIITVGINYPEVVTQIAGRFRRVDNINLHVIVRTSSDTGISKDSIANELNSDIVDNMKYLMKAKENSMTSDRGYFIANLFDHGLDGEEVKISKFAYQHEIYTRIHDRHRVPFEYLVSYTKKYKRMKPIEYYPSYECTELSDYINEELDKDEVLQEDLILEFVKDNIMNYKIDSKSMIKQFEKEISSNKKDISTYRYISNQIINFEGFTDSIDNDKLKFLYKYRTSKKYKELVDAHCVMNELTEAVSYKDEMYMKVAATNYQSNHQLTEREMDKKLLKIFKLKYDIVRKNIVLRTLDDEYESLDEVSKEFVKTKAFKIIRQVKED